MHVEARVQFCCLLTDACCVKMMVGGGDGGGGGDIENTPTDQSMSSRHPRTHKCRQYPSAIAPFAMLNLAASHARTPALPSRSEHGITFSIN